ncbi:MAG: hypothetical protein OXI64_03790 [Defluviicoccus sp.]|nr:hypothetical protein [Defluviicoccus sp.]
MSLTDLQVHCHNFAAGRPALAFSLEQLELAVDAFGSALAGNFPHGPHPTMRNAKLPVYELAYSVFVNNLKLSIENGSPKLCFALLATVHPYRNPSKVIATYNVKIKYPLDVFLSYSQTTRQLRWTSRENPFATVYPEFMNDAEDILRGLQVPEPVLDKYKHDVEAIVLWATSSSIVNLVVNALPPIDIGEMVPWLTLLHPLQFDFGERYLIITSERSQMSIGGCSPVDVLVGPDPDFPYQAEPRSDEHRSTERSRAVAAVYLPKTRLVEFVSNSVMPAVMYDSGERGGTIRWRMNGAFGLKEFIVDISGGIQAGNPWSGALTLRGTLSAFSAVALAGVARAWIDGPCGSKVGLANASVQGDGKFLADIQITYRSPGEFVTPDYGATLEAELVVRHATVKPEFELDALGWPIDEIVTELIEHLAEREVHKLSGMARKLGSWDMVSVPSWLVDLLGNGQRFAPVVESLSGVSSVIGIAVNDG